MRGSDEVWARGKANAIGDFLAKDAKIYPAPEATPRDVDWSKEFHAQVLTKFDRVQARVHDPIAMGDWISVRTELLLIEKGSGEEVSWHVYNAPASATASSPRSGTVGTGCPPWQLERRSPPTWLDPAVDGLGPAPEVVWPSGPVSSDRHGAGVPRPGRQPHPVLAQLPRAHALAHQPDLGLQVDLVPTGEFAEASVCHDDRVDGRGGVGNV